MLRDLRVLGFEGLGFLGARLWGFRVCGGYKRWDESR